MIISGQIKGERFILTAESASDATVVKRGLAGKNLYLATAPYGNRVTPSTENNLLILEKHTGQPFAYEEIHALLRRIFGFGRISREKLQEIMIQARERLQARLTLFYPSQKDPKVEVMFASNWAAFEFSCSNFELIYPEVRDVVTKNENKSIKVFSNNTDIISIHNYDMHGIYVSRSSFEGIADVLVSNGLLAKDEKNAFVVKATAYGLKSVFQMEAREICQSSEEMFDLTSEVFYNPMLGDKNFLSALVLALQELSQKGSFDKIARDQLFVFYNLLKKPETLQSHKIHAEIGEGIKFFVKNFSSEISQHYLQEGGSGTAAVGF